MLMKGRQGLVKQGGGYPTVAHGWGGDVGLQDTTSPEDFEKRES